MRFGSDDRFSLTEKNAFTTGVGNKLREYDCDLKVANKQLNLDTANKAAAKVQSKTDLTYNPDRLKEVTRDILNMEVFQMVKDDLLALSDDDIERKYVETYLRNALSTEVLITTAGKRPSTIGYMRLEELKNPETLPDGSKDVSVHFHKTKDGGASHLSFIREGLYAACMRYVEIYKKGKSPKAWVFATTSGKPHNLRESITWLRPLIPRSIATEEEIRSITAKTFRKGFSNWGAEHPDPVVNRDTIEAQDHSERVDVLNYRVKSGHRVNAVNRVLMAEVGMDMRVEHEDPGHASESSTEHEDPEVSAGTEKAKRKSRFTQSQRDYMRMALGTRRKDGSIRPPVKMPTNEDIRIARSKFPHFGDIYDSVLKSTGKTQSFVNRVIWSSVKMQTKKKKPAPTENVRPAPAKQLLSENESDSSDTDAGSNSITEADSDSDGSEFDYGIGQKRGKKRKASDKVFSVGKKARKVKTPGSQ